MSRIFRKIPVKVEPADDAHELIDCMLMIGTRSLFGINNIERIKP